MMILPCLVKDDDDDDGKGKKNGEYIKNNNN